MTKIVVIGGSGLENPGLLKLKEEYNIETKYGKPSSPLNCGKAGGNTGHETSR